MRLTRPIHDRTSRKRHDEEPARRPDEAGAADAGQSEARPGRACANGSRRPGRSRTRQDCDDVPPRRAPGFDRRVAPKAAQRMALHLLQHDRDGALRLARALEDATRSIHNCERCNTFTEDVVCALCRSSKRDPTELCIVETPADLLMVEHSQAYS